MSFKNYKTRALHEMDIDWKIKNTLTSQKTDHKTGTTTYGKRWMSDQERVAKSNAMMTGVKMDADGLVPDAGAFVKGHLDKAINTTANTLDSHKGMRDKVANKFNLKNIDGATFRSMASNATKDTAFNINKNVPGTTAYRYQGVANAINSKNLKSSYEPEGEMLEAKYEKNMSKKQKQKVRNKRAGLDKAPEGSLPVMNPNMNRRDDNEFNRGIKKEKGSKKSGSILWNDEFTSYEEVEVFVESLSEQGYTEEQILLELDRKGLGSVVLGKSLELGMGAIKNTFRAGRVVRGAVNRAVSDTKLLKKIDNTARTLRNQGGNTFKGFKDRAGSIVNRVKGKLNRTDIKTNTVTKSVNPQVLGGAAAKKTPVVNKLKNITPAGQRIKNATNKIKTTATNVAKTGTAVAGSKITTPSSKKVTPAAVTNGGKKEVTPTKNPVVTKTTERGRSVDRAYGAMIAQTRKLKGDAAANKQRQKFINRPMTSKEMDESVKDELLDRAQKAHKKAKSFKQWRRDSGQKPLQRGEVRKLDKKTGKWVSNKPD